jgi:NAD(P)-dependent dehydrogenase (short-subunit alcohol dehydrogenase family)
LKLDGRVCVITGGARGIGEAIAQRFAAEGGTVALWDLDGAAAVAAAGPLGGSGHGCDVQARADVERAHAETLAAHGRVDVLVNNAGISPLYDGLTDVTEEYWDKVIGVNLKGPFRLGALVGERMQRRGGGSIINVSSTGAVRPTRDIIPYAAAKAGVNAMTIGLADALGPEVRVNAIVPGPFLTSIARNWDMELLASRTDTFPLRRAGEAREIVGAALYLASDASSFTTGTLLTVDGGAQWSMPSNRGGPR